MEQPIISKHCHALLDVPPIYGDVTEIARGSDKHGRHLRVVELLFGFRIPVYFPTNPPKCSISRLFKALKKPVQNPQLFPDFPAPYEPCTIQNRPKSKGLEVKSET